MSIRLVTRPPLAVILAVACALCVAATPARGKGSGSTGQGPEDSWPRTFKLGNATAVVYQPQVESWKDNRIEFRAAVGVKPAGAAEETYGVIWAAARTEVDRVTRMVDLEELTLTKSNFPTLADQGASYLSALQKHFSSNRTIALDRLEAAFAASGTVKPVPVQVNNDPPRILVSYAPAILVTIQGTAVVRPVTGTGLERVINTRALILREQGSSTWYLHVYDGWLYAGVLSGAWYQPIVQPPGLDEAAGELAKSGVVDLIDGGDAEPKPSLAKGVPAILVSETPAELLVFEGQPAFTPIEGTGLGWASNTASYVLLDTASKDYYVLISGRWYRSRELAGPWSYVAATSLPADFSRIPSTSPAAAVLASVAGTPQAQEAVIANSIPQTATVPLANGPAFTPTFDGPPEFRPVEGTSYTYAVNSPAPIIRMEAAGYYALQSGVWFVASAPIGPWVIATAVPAGIYAIPATSPIHYVTYVRVYGATPTAVYVGYTPGYMGTVVAPGGVVVYGTGYTYAAWVGSVYYPPPVTFGVMAQPVYYPAVGVTYRYSTSVVAVSYSSTAYHAAYYGSASYGAASANVYGSAGATTWSGNRSAYYGPGGAYGTTASGTYKNQATGTTGTYQAGRGYNPNTGQAAAGYSRTVNTPAGGSGQVSRSATYNTQTGTSTRSGSASASKGGLSTSVSGSGSVNASGQGQGQVSRTSANANTGLSKTTTTSGATGQSASRTSTVSNANTGQSRTHSSGQAYAGKDGNVYRNTGSSSGAGGSGWQKSTGSGWQGASGDTSWADKEQQARSQGEEKFNSFKQSGGGRSWGGGGEGGSWGGGGGGGWGGRGGGRR